MSLLSFFTVSENITLTIISFSCSNKFLTSSYLILLPAEEKEELCLDLVGGPSKTGGSFHRKKDELSVICPRLAGRDIKRAGRKNFSKAVVLKDPVSKEI